MTTTQLAKALFGPIDAKARTEPSSLWHSKIKTHGQSDVYVVDNKIAPGGSTGWHSHPGTSLILVVAGTVTNYMGDGRMPHVYHAGEGFIDRGGKEVHILRNEDPSVEAETIAVQFLPQGAVRRIDQPDPGTCH